MPNLCRADETGASLNLAGAAHPDLTAAIMCADVLAFQAA